MRCTIVIHRCAVFLVLCALAFAVPASAQTRAWLDRDRIALDETVTLTLQLDAKSIVAMPDLAALGRNFSIVDQQSQQQVTWVNGELTAQVTIQMTLAPLREGEIEIHSLWTGKDAIAPLRLTVLPPRDPRNAIAPPPEIETPGVPVFIETRIDSETPYVQQSVGYTLRLYYPLGSQIEGRLDQDPPEGASLQKVGDEVRVTTRVGSTDYAGVERRYLLIPERSGPVTVPPAVFRGRAMGLFESLFDTSRKEITITSKPIALQVKTIPVNAPQPWLPARAVRLRYLETPQSMRVGKSATLTVELVAEGATAAQLPELMVQAGSDAQVFADPAQVDDRFLQGRPQATVVRRFSVLPSRDGTLRIVAPRVAWWDAQAGVARIATLPDLILQVMPGPAGMAAPASANASAAADDAPPRGSWAWMADRRWLWMGIALAVLWTSVAVWAWQLWSSRRNAAPAVTLPAKPADGRVPPPRADAQALAQALARGRHDEIARTLCAMASPPVADLDALRERLSEPAQLAAVEALQCARWGRGDPADAVAAARIAFAQGPRWRAPVMHAPGMLLPPLYPER